MKINTNVLHQLDSYMDLPNKEKVRHIKSLIWYKAPSFKKELIGLNEENANKYINDLYILISKYVS